MRLMIQSIGLIELSSIAKGIECCDEMLKAAQVALVKATTICPGKYIILIAGDVGSVKASLSAGEKKGGECIVNVMIIPNSHEQLIPAINGTGDIPIQDAIGVIEFFSIASAIKAADEAVKAAEVYLMDVKIGYAIGGKGVVILTGEVGAVRVAIEAAKRIGKEDGYMMNSVVIPRPSKELVTSLM